MAIECAYSFADLFKAAHHKEPEETEMENLYSLNQEAINEVVKLWAVKAGWETKQRLGSDGQIYFAFAPEFK